ncbi:hypothetical protein P152DRAFT_457061 [Eremomyces bilateralis CBS 781.70]|uniref:PHD-type domain-containing protein n=1 Tax=Eremomyces bilateralis CBS 781.70 TaxID=1392243 RepID=A0A6G1G6M1_9PEZI|nr:uncharacterized protein P152DRAFT_457061 [Eremomyces bilateralis CBS 781.70]KAF1813688.1 hypothetical protein P152DRAFT_457061 [Eremomyces bilateralis CBS 781.70]
MATAPPNRRLSTRVARSSAAKPANYYGRQAAAAEPPPRPDNPPGFFPAITHFTNSVAMLPEEVMKHFSMLKEVESKSYGPDHELKLIAEAITKLPAPMSRYSQPAAGSASNGSVNPSANASVNGSVDVAGTPMHTQAIAKTLFNSAKPQPALDPGTDMNRTQLMHRMCFAINHMAPILDEKIAVLGAANVTLSRQLERIDSSFPYIENEISEEARLGSLTHWALQNKEAKKPVANERPRREGASNTNYAVYHDDAAASRSEARRGTLLAKKGRGQQQQDSDFDDRYLHKKATTNSRVRKTADAGDKVVGLGITGAAASQPAKRRKTEKGAAMASAMERSTSGQGGPRGGAMSPREPAAVEPPKKKPKQAPGPLRKRAAAGTAASPRTASSPLQGTFAVKDAPTSSRPVGRGRQNSQTSAQVALDNAARNRPASSASNLPLTAPTSQPVKPDGASHTVSPPIVTAAHIPIPNANAPSTAPESFKREEQEPDVPADVPMTETEPPTSVPAVATATRTRASKTSTPVTSTFPADVSGAAPATGAGASGRANNKNNSSTNSSHASSESNMPLAATARRRNARKRRDTDGMEVDEREPEKETPVAEAAVVDSHEEVEEEEDEDGDEPRYCYCNQVSYGEMVACDNESCKREWFHLKCAGLKEAPTESTKWYCDECKATMKENNRRSRPASRQ